MLLPFQVGERIGNAYEIRSVIEDAGDGCVLDAEDLFLHRPVAIRVVDAAHTSAMMQEAQGYAAVRHPCVPAIYGYGTDRGCGYLALEKVDGTTVAQALAERARAPEWFHLGEAITLITALAEAIAALHRAGRAHGALGKTAVLVCGDDRIVLRDLGRGNGVAARQDDMRAFGAIGYELLTGDAPADDARDAAAIRPDTPYPLADLLRACLADDPAMRPSIERAVTTLHALPRPRRRRAA